MKEGVIFNKKIYTRKWGQRFNNSYEIKLIEDKLDEVEEIEYCRTEEDARYSIKYLIKGDEVIKAKDINYKTKENLENKLLPYAGKNIIVKLDESVTRLRTPKSIAIQLVNQIAHENNIDIDLKY